MIYEGCADVSCSFDQIELKLTHAKQNNVFVNDDLSIVIADFGLSVFANGHSNNYASRREGNSQWLSPELLNPDSRTRPTKASDVYSFAMVCIEVIYTVDRARNLSYSENTDVHRANTISGVQDGWQ